MSKFKFIVEVELQGLKIKWKAQRRCSHARPADWQTIGRTAASARFPRIGGWKCGRRYRARRREVDSENGAGKKQRKPRKGGTGGRTPSETISLSHDSAAYGSPLQGWTTAQKAVWFFYIANKQANVTQLTATNTAKNFNKYFRASGIIHGGNVSQGLEKERLKGVNATVNADMTDATAKYSLTQAGITLAEKTR